MKSIYTFLIIIFISIEINAQISGVHFIDVSTETAGVSKIVSADLDNDGFDEIITSTSGSEGRLGYYTNNKDNTFSDFNLIESFEFCRGFAIGDFNNDNWIDIVSFGGINNEARIHWNNSGSFAASVILDSNISIQVNDAVVADFDNDSFDDMVIIGQHSIDFYRNNGNGSFTKEVILSTSTSPLPLECFKLSVVDLDNDGNLDLICGETAGLVTYMNNGNAEFTAQYHSVISELIILVHPFDIDGDGEIDVVVKNSANQTKWFRNDGFGNMSYVATFSNFPNVKSISSIDYNNDGLDDIYASYEGNISIFENDFSHEVSVYQDNSLLMGEIQTANIDNQNGVDYVWSGGNNTLAFHIDESTVSLDIINPISLIFFPNPTLGIIHFTSFVDHLKVFNVNGYQLMEVSKGNEIDLSHLAKGVYILSIDNSTGISNHKIIKN